MTASGNVEGVVTPLCIFEKVDGRLRVKSIHQDVTPDALRAATGFDLGDLEPVPTTPETHRRRARRTRCDADPEGVRLREFI